MLNLVDLKKENIIAIGIDCGFGDVKITINETNYKFPSYIIPFSDGSSLNFLGGNSDENSSLDTIIYRENVNNRSTVSYLIGTQAQTLINNDKEGKYTDFVEKSKDLHTFFTENDASIFLIRAALSYAIVRYSFDNSIGFKLENLRDYRIFVELAFPHVVTEKAFNSLSGPLSMNTELNLQINNNSYTMELRIPKEYIKGSSQVLDVFYSYAYSDKKLSKNELVKNFKKTISSLPAIVCDGGYRSQGVSRIFFSNGFMVSDSKSYEEYSMIEVNEKIAAIINDLALKQEPIDFTPIHEYDISRFINDNLDFTFNVYADNAVGKKRKRITSAEISKIHDEVLQETAKDYCNFLINDYGIDNARTILVAGGTGTAFFDIISEYMNNYSDGEVEVLLCESTYDDRKIFPVFAIVMGAYKHLLMQIEEILSHEE